MPIGRPSKFTKQVADEICYQIATSSKGLKRICDADPNLPTYRTVFTWLNDPDKAEFLQSYTRARENQADYMADEILKIADKVRIGTKTVSKVSGEEITTGDMVERSRLMVEARKWLASKLKPKKYGDKLDLTSGGDKLAPVIIDWAGTHGNKPDTQTEGGA